MPHRVYAPSIRTPRASVGPRLVTAIVALSASCAVTAADEPPAKPTMPPARAVKEGNQFLKGGNPTAALERYREAKAAQPDAREIAFDEGLAHHALGEYDKARESFQRAAGGESDELADDAIYSTGAVDHAEALAQSEDPKAAMSKLENAMQQYQSVLSRRPDHERARDANYKAASYWRQLKQIQQQQQQQQQQSGENQENEQSEQEKQEQSAEQNEEQQQEQEQEQQSASQQQEQSQKSQEQQQEAQKQDAEQQQEEQQTAQAEEKEDVSREQAERQLREMVQTQRDRKKRRREEVRKVPIQPVEKDW